MLLAMLAAPALGDAGKTADIWHRSVIIDAHGHIGSFKGYQIGLEPLMASAIAERQQWVADLAQEGTFEGVSEKDWRDYADRTKR